MALNENALLCWQLRSSTSRISLDQNNAKDEGSKNLPEKISAGNGRFSLSYKRFKSGRSDGLYCLTIDTGAITTTILPDRGMGIWKCWCGDLEFGWQSPVQGPVHPSLVPVHDASGIGWLEGFDELFVRCGLYSNGAPEFSQNGCVRFPLHGRIANLPAHRLEIQVDVENGILDVIGIVSEARFLVYSLELQTRYRFRAGNPVVEVIDTVTNRSTQAGSMQMLYHINVGQPIVQSGSKIHTAFRKLTPRDMRATTGIENWNQCDGPVSGYAEQVYYIVPLTDEQQWTEAMLASPDGSYGFAVHCDMRSLPYLNVWKNTAAVEDGYVVGLEPATGYPNTRSVEERGGRVISLQGGESKSFRLKLQPLTSTNDVTQSRSRIEKLQSISGVVSAVPFSE